MTTIQEMLPTEYRSRFQSLSIPERHLAGLDSITFSIARIVLSYDIMRAKAIAGFCATDLETLHSEITLKPNADQTDLAHEVGHHVLNGMVSSKDFALVADDWKKAKVTEAEFLFNCGLSVYSLKDEEEFFADVYSVWSMKTPLYRKARILIRELFPNTARILDNLFSKGEDNDSARAYRPANQVTTRR